MHCSSPCVHCTRTQYNMKPFEPSVRLVTVLHTISCSGARFAVHCSSSNVHCTHTLYNIKPLGPSVLLVTVLHAIPCSVIWFALHFLSPSVHCTWCIVQFMKRSGPWGAIICGYLHHFWLTTQIVTFNIRNNKTPQICRFWWDFIHANSEEGSRR